MSLNLRQRRFVAHYLKLGNATEAYIAAGYAKNNAACSASLLLDNPKISKYIDQMQRTLEAETKIDLEWCLRGFVDEAEDLTNSDGARIKARELAAKMLGAFTERSEVLVKIDPEMAAKKAQQLLAEALVIEDTKPKPDGK